MPFSPLDALMQVGAPKRAAESTPRQDGAGAFQPALEQAYRAEAPRPAPEPAPRKPATETRSAANGQRDEDDRADQSATSAKRAATSDESGEPRTEENADAVEISEEAAAAVVVTTAVGQNDAETIVASLNDGDSGETAIEKNAAAEGENQESNVPGDDALGAEAALDASTADDDQESTDGEAPKMSPLHSGKQQKRDGTPVTEPDESGQTDQPVEEPLIDGKVTAKSDAQLQAEAATEKARKLSAAAREQGDGGQDGLPGEGPSASASQSHPAAATAVEPASIQAELTATAETATADSPTAPPIAQAEAASGAEAAPRSQRALDRLMAGHSSRQAKETTEPNGMPTVDRARFINRVEGAMRAAHQGDGRISVRLSPPDLGSVKIELALQNGVLSAKLEAETPAARNLLLDSLPALRERLAQQDIQIEKFDVDVRQEGSAQQGSGEADDRAPNQSGERPSGRTRTGLSRTPMIATPVRPPNAAASSAGLDVRV